MTVVEGRHARALLLDELGPRGGARLETISARSWSNESV